MTDNGNPTTYSLGQAYDLVEWFDVDDARKAARMIAQSRRALEGIIEEHIDKVADAERDYDRKVGTRTEYHRGEGKGSGEAELLAKKDAADDKRNREHAREMLRLLFKKLDGLDGERAVFRQMADWSSRMGQNA